MDLSLNSICDGSNNVHESLMDVSFPLSRQCQQQCWQCQQWWQRWPAAVAVVAAVLVVVVVAEAVAVAQVALTTALGAEAVLLLSLLTIHL